MERRKAVWGPRRLTALVLAGALAWPLGQLAAQEPGTAFRVPGTRIIAAPVRIEPVDGSDAAGLGGITRSITIRGIVQNHVGTLVPNAGLIVLRRLADGEAVGRTQVNSSAQFLLRGFDPGTYAAELVDHAGSVIATSGAFTAGAGQVVELAPVIPASPSSGLIAVLTSATDGALNSAMSAGLTAVGAGMPVSAR
jgi:hypothetical protein